MRRVSREINTLSISALDLFATAMGAFAIIMLILFPHYGPGKTKAAEPARPEGGKAFTNSLGMKFAPLPRTKPAATPAPSPAPSR